MGSISILFMAKNTSPVVTTLTSMVFGQLKSPNSLMDTIKYTDVAAGNP